MIRQSLDADSPYADVALHGEGLTSLQFRDAKGAPPTRFRPTSPRPAVCALEKRGDFYLSVSRVRRGRTSASFRRVASSFP